MAKEMKPGAARKKSKPSGADEIKAALLVAADRLFGQKGPDAVSVRDIAAAAGLTPTLIHRYFGSKDELIREVLRHHIATFREAAGAMPSPQNVVSSMFDVMSNNPAFLRVIAYILLEGHEPEGYLTKTGMVANLADALNPIYKDEAKLEAAILVSQMMGWLLFEPFLLYVSDFDGEPAAARAEVFSRLIQSLPQANHRRRRSPASTKVTSS